MSHPEKNATLTRSLIELLRQNNPFDSNAAPSPWNNTLPDVATINKQAFDEICALIKRKTQSPQTPLAGLVLGEAGEGKTHLLRRILNACRKSETASLFVFVKPLLDPERPFHLLLQEIVHCLSKKSEGEECFSQFERLVAEIIRDYVRYRVTNDPKCDTPNNRSFLEQFEADVFHVYDTKKVRAGLMEEIISDRVSPISQEIIEQGAVRYIHSQVPETNKSFLDVLFQYKTPEKQGIVRDWLQGTVLNDEDCNQLGVISRADFSIEAMENESRKMILTLGVLFARYHLPMVVCFDQLDNLIQPDLIAGFVSMIHLLVNDAASMLPVAFIRADSWNERFRTYPDDAFVHRLENNKLNLSGCRADEAKELVSRRIEAMFGEKTSETIAITNWFLPQLESKLKGRAYNSPREVIRYANDIIRGYSGETKSVPSIAKSMAAEYKAAHEAVAVDFDGWNPAESEYLKKAAELFLKNQESVLTCEPGDNKYMTWTGIIRQNGTQVPYACFINTSKHWKTMTATLERCLSFLEEHPNGICSYITDARCGFRPTWNIANERRKEFESRGGNVLILDQPAAVRWYGLVALAMKIGCGDISLETDRGWVTATEKELDIFLRSEFSNREATGNFQFLLQPKPKDDDKIGAEPPTISDKELIAVVRDILTGGQLPVLAIEHLMVKLGEKGIDISRESCLEQLGRNQNAVTLMQTRDSFTVKIVL